MEKTGISDRERERGGKKKEEGVKSNREQKNRRGVEKKKKKGVVRQMGSYLNESQRFVSAADQRSLLLPLLLHDGGKGHSCSRQRAGHPAQHPRPDG